MMAISHQAVLEHLKPHSTPDRPIYVVGGAVRDMLLNRPVHDLDLAMPGPTLPLARRVADALGGGLYVMDEERDTTRVVLNTGEKERLLLDFAALRGGSIEADLRSRDFTINAMAYDVAQSNHLLDPTGGLADLREKRLRACQPTSLSDDPARVLRVVRQALALRFRIDPETVRLARSAAPLLENISPERRRDELFKMLDGRHVARAIEILDHLGALGALLPEMRAMKGVTQSAPHIDDVWDHTLAVVRHLEALLDVLVGAYNEDAAADLFSGLAVMRLGRFREQFEQHFAQPAHIERTRRSLLFLAALYHDIAKPLTRTQEADGKIRFLGHPESGAQAAGERARALALSNVEVQLLEQVIQQHMRCHFMTTDLLNGGEPPSRRTIFRYFRDTGPTGVEICLLSLADLRGTWGVGLPQSHWLAELDVCRALLEAYWEQGEQVVAPPRLLTGHDVMKEFGLPPGQMIGRLLEAIREGQAAGEIHNREEAFDFARCFLAQQAGGLTQGER